MSDSVQVSLWKVIFRLPVALKIQLAVIFGACCAAMFSMGMYLGQELIRYTVGYKDIELFMVRNELAEARRTLDAISLPASSATAAPTLDRPETPMVLSTEVDADGPVAAGYMCVSQQLKLLGLYAGEPVNQLTSDLRAASEKYVDYMTRHDEGWRQPPLEDVTAGLWCDRAAAAFANLQPYLDDYKQATSR